METIPISQAVVKITLDQILVVPEDNPRGAYSQREVDEMALSLKLGGQQTPILLRPRAEEERAQAHPDRPYKLVGGYLRVAAAPLAGLTALDAIIRPMTPRQARRAAILDNVRKDMHWLAWGESAEGLLADDPDMTIQDAADFIGQDRAKVSKALKLLKVLSKPARAAIRVNYTTPGGYPLPEACGLCLGDLANGGPGDQDLIERAVKVALAKRMKLEKVEKLVDWVKKGGQPEDFGAKEPKDTPEDPMAAHWPQLGPGFKVKYKRGGGYEVRIAIPDGQQAWNAAMAAKRAMGESREAGSFGFNNPSPLAGVAGVKGASPSVITGGQSPHNSVPLSARAGAWVTGNILWKQIQHIPGHILNRLFPHLVRPQAGPTGLGVPGRGAELMTSPKGPGNGFTRLFHQTTAGVQRMGVKNQVWATFITLFLVLMVGSFLISLATRLLTYLAYEIVYSPKVMPHLSSDPYPSIGHKPMDEPGLSRIEAPSEGKAPKSDPGQGGGQGLVVPSRGAEGTKEGSAPTPPVLASTPLPAVSQPPITTSSVAKGISESSKPKAQVSVAKPVTVFAPAPTQQVDETGKIIGQAVTTMAGDAAKKFLGF